MKKKFHFLLLPLISSFLWGCASEIDFIESSLRTGDAESTFSGGDLALNFSSSAGSASVDLEATGKWTAAFVNGRAKDWCTLSSSEGKRGKATVTVSVSENLDYDQRSATIVFSCGDVNRSIVVTQKQKDAILLTSNRIDVGPSGGQVEVEVKANVSFGYSISKDAESWITPIGTRSLSTSVLSFEVKANDSLEKRDGMITITSPAGEEVVKVYQEGDSPRIVPGKNLYELSCEAQEISIDVRHNVDVTMTIPGDCGWVTESRTRSTSTSVFHLKIAENEGFTSRSCQLVFRSEDLDLTEEVILEQQAATPQLFIGEWQYEFDPVGGEMDIEVTSNFEVAVSVPDTCSWIRVSETKALTTRSFHVTIEPNETFAERSGCILFRNDELGKEEIVRIRQKAETPTLFVGEWQYEFDPPGGELDIEVTSNYEVAVAVPDTCSWIKVSRTKAMVTRTFHVTVGPNETFAERSGCILFRNDELGKEEAIRILQKAETPTLIIGEHQHAFEPEGGILQVDLASNMTLDIEIPPSCDWLKEVTTRSVTERRHLFSVGKNHGRVGRSAWIVFKNESLECSDTVFVSQAFQPILVSNDTLMAPSRGCTVSFETVGPNPSDYRLEFVDDWLSPAGQEKISGHSRFQVSVGEQSGGAPTRDGRILVHYADYACPDTVLVRQFGRLPSFSFTSTSRMVRVPDVEGENQQGFVYWGDDSVEPYAPGLTHRYASSGVHTVTVEIRSKKRVPFKSLENGMTINVKELRNK